MKVVRKKYGTVQAIPTGLTAEEREEKQRNIVRRLSRGNVALQSGRYATRKKIDRRKAEVLNYNFNTLQ